MEIFKESKKSICNRCYNINETCSTNVFMTCGTDNKIEKAYVESCMQFNKPIDSCSYKKYTIKTSHKADTRVEMMGGGHE